MDDKQEEIERYSKVHTILNDLLDSTDWSRGAVLKVSEKKIKAMRDEVMGHIKQLEKHLKQETLFQPVQVNSDESPIYVVMYLSRGVSLENWYQRIMSLPSHSVGLPIFTSSKAAKKYMRSKTNVDNHGVVEVMVKKSVLEGAVSGEEVKQLPGGAIRVDRIRSFDDGKHAYWFMPKSPLTKIESESL